MAKLDLGIDNGISGSKWFFVAPRIALERASSTKPLPDLISKTDGYIKYTALGAAKSAESIC